MSTANSHAGLTHLKLHVEPIVELSDDQLFELCALNPELRIERTSQGDLVVMSPTGGETSDRNAQVTVQLSLWARSEGCGRAFDSSAGFLLPNGAMRSPDAAWVELTRLATIPPEQRKRFLPLCPTFVVEICSPSDSFVALEAKLEEFIANGTHLGWLIDPEERRVVVFRPGAAVEMLERPREVSGDPELPGFVLELDEIWQPPW